MEIDSLAISAKWSMMQPKRLIFDWTTDSGIRGRADTEFFSGSEICGLFSVYCLGSQRQYQAQTVSDIFSIAD